MSGTRGGRPRVAGPPSRTDAGAGLPRAGDAPAEAAQEAESGPSDDALDQFILVRLASLGVDLTVLPEDDEDAPADQRRILRSARRFLRSTPPAIQAYEMDEQTVAPLMYPAESSHRTRGEDP